MKLNISLVSEKPLYQQLIDELKGQIFSGKLKAGDHLKSIREMAFEQSISVITVQKAYEELSKMGLIHSLRGRGFVVASIDADDAKTMKVKLLKEHARPLIETAFREGLKQKEIQSVLNEIIKDLGDKS
jgi:GntR family transcriptional regulator